jgi:hypothetical protein
MSKRTGTMMVLLAGLALMAGPPTRRPAPTTRPAVVEAGGLCTATAPAPTRHRLQPWEEGCSDSAALAQQ